MRKHRILPIACLMVVILIVQVSPETGLVAHKTGVQQDTIESSVSFTDYIPDPTFDSEPETVVVGSSDEFTSSYHGASGENDFNYMELDWQHAANTSLAFGGVADVNLPDCSDFIYFYQEFQWDSNEMPLDAELQINFTTILTGSFATEESGQIMFRAFAWMIDSSGHWQRVLRTYPPYQAGYREIESNLAYFDIYEAWGGMIQDSTGTQEDPEDTLQVAIGLAPTHAFESQPGSGGDPWEFYDGSVSIRVRSMQLWVYMEEQPDPSQVLSPLSNDTWRYTARDVFPDIPEEFENASRVDFRDITTDADGSVYILCDTYSSFELTANQSKSFHYSFILKYSDRLELLWSTRDDNETSGYSIAVHGGALYTAGYRWSDDAVRNRNLIVTKWSQAGEKLWQTEWGGAYDEEGAAITVAPDGSIFVWSTYRNIRYEPEFWKSSFLKFDDSGTLLWNKTCEIPVLVELAMLEAQQDGLYTWDSIHVEKRDFNCEPLWDISLLTSAVGFDADGNVYTAHVGEETGEHSDEWQIMVSKWDSAGNELWDSNYTVPLPDGHSWYFRCYTLDVAPDGSVLALLHGQSLTYEYHMVKFDSEGTFQWDKIVGDSHWPLPGMAEPTIEIGSNRLAYVGYGYRDDYGAHLGVSAFVIGPYDIGPDIPLTLVIVGIAGVSVAVVAAALYMRKHQ